MSSGGYPPAGVVVLNKVAEQKVPLAAPKICACENVVFPLHHRDAHCCEMKLLEVVPFEACLRAHA